MTMMRPRSPLVHALLLISVVVGAFLARGSDAFTTPTRVGSIHVIAPRSNSFNIGVLPHSHSPTTRRSSSTTTTTLYNSNPALALYEKYADQLPSQKVVQACAGQRVVASDLATKAGISVSEAQRELTLLASLSRGDIAVSQDGDLIYSFPSDLQNVLSQTSSQYKLQQTFRKSWPTLFWAIRVGFGVALVASLVAIYSTIFFINTSSSSDDRDDRGPRGGGGGFGGGFNYFWGPSPFDFFYYRPYGYYGYYGRDAQRRDPEELGFFESVYSYVFGDGNPNIRREEERLQLAAQMIRDNQGAVTAEQLAPYCDPEITPQQAAKSNYVDESFVLPIVTQLNGEPTVTDDGDIVYLFPELQTTASKQTKSIAPSSVDTTALILKRAGLSPTATSQEIQLFLNFNGISTRNAYDKDSLLAILEKALPPLTQQEQAALDQEQDYADPTVLTEREIPFSVATDFNKVLAGGLGVVNLGGALYLGNQLAQITAAGYTLPGIYGTIAGAFPLLLGYALLFNAIPLARNFWLQRQNAQIQQRNNLRKQWKVALASSVSTALQKKLKAAKALGQKMKRLGSSSRDVIFDTSKTTVEELGQKKEQSDLSAFDKLLEQESSDKEPKKKKASLDGDSDLGAFE